MGTKWNVTYPSWGVLDEADYQARPRPIKWLDATELWKAAVRHVLSTRIGEYVDRRELAGRVLLTTGDLDAAVDVDPEDSGADGQGFDPVWIDYVADVGDGYRATFAVAQSLDSDHLYRLDSESDPYDLPNDDETHVAPRGQYLIYGGDLVYPWPKLTHYEDRFKTPYRYLFHNRNYNPIPELAAGPTTPTQAPPQPSGPNPRTILAIPGNHDWYDGLAEFSNLIVFEDRLAECPVPQKYSYWAMSPHPAWQVWGVDIALIGRPDTPQLAYFTHHRERFGVEGSPLRGLVVCVAKPFWEEDYRDPRNERAFLLARYLWTILPPEADRVVFLSGDKHYLAAWGPDKPGDPGSLCVTAGGGGAYLAATKGVPESISDPWPDVVDPPQDRLQPTTPGPPEPESGERLDRRVRLAAIWDPWPSHTDWKRGTWWRIPLGVWSTPSFVGVMAVVYGVVALSLGMIASGSLVATGRGSTPAQVGGCELRIDAEANGAATRGLGTDGAATGGVGPEGVGTADLADVIRCIGAEDPATGAWDLASASLSQPAALPIVALMVGGSILVARAGGRRGWRPWLAGGAHGAAHLVLVTIVSAAAMAFAVSLVAAESTGLPLWATEYLSTVAFLTIVGVVGGLAGSLLVALYLVVGSRLRLNLNEASAALRDERWKHFLRLRLSYQGIEVLAFGIDEPVDIEPRSDSRAQGPLVESHGYRRGPLRRDEGDENVRATHLVWRKEVRFPSGAPGSSNP